MSRKSIWAAVVLVWLAGTGSAGPVEWSFRAPDNEAIFPPGATGGITFPNTGYQAGTPEIVATKVATWSIASADSPDRIADLAYRFSLDVRDESSGQMATLSFQGLLTGSYWRTGSDLTNVFVGSTLQSVELGGNRYAVSLLGFDAPTGYGDQAAGQITASIKAGLPVKDGGHPTTPNVVTPEPASLLLAALGLPALGLARRRAKKR